MKNSILVFFLLILFLSCNNDKQNERLKNAINFETEQIQQFNLPPDSIISITGNKGTKLTFKIEDLEGLINGTTITDSLQINLIELTSKQDLLYVNAQTVSNGKWLISGGAFKIDILAKKGGESLTLKKGKTINVVFPKSINKTGMQLFYGERDGFGNLNWEKSNLKLDEKKYFSIFYTLASQLDSTLTRDYGIDVVEDYFISDTLGYLTLNEYKLKHPKTDSIYFVNDTLSNLKSWRNYKDFLSDISQYQIITQSFYNSIEIEKLGWINIDQFTPEEEKVVIKLSFKPNIEIVQTFLIDQRNNTLVSFYKDELIIPINRSFHFICFGINDGSYYAYKKSVRFNKNGEYLVDFKKVKKNQLKSILKLD